VHHQKAIEINGLSYSYPDGTVALTDISLDIENGESVAVLGPNGAGKSTFLLHLNGILSGNGEIKIFGVPLVKRNLKEIRRRVGMVFQDPNDQLFSPTVFDDVAFGPTNMGLSHDEIHNKVDFALDAVDMKEFEKKSAFHLSYGQKKRVSIATVLSMEPDILALDEPSSNLDSQGREKLKKIVKSFPITKVIVTHDILFVFDLCKRGVVLSKGKIVADAPMKELIKDVKLLKENGIELPHGVKLENS
jgi:cobalt/nickel transport system ATP-binding protein